MVANIIYAIIGHSSLSSIQAGALPIHVDDGLGEGLRGSRRTEEAAAMRIDFFRHRFSPIRLEGLDSSSEDADRSVVAACCIHCRDHEFDDGFVQRLMVRVCQDDLDLVRTCGKTNEDEGLAAGISPVPRRITRERYDAGWPEHLARGLSKAGGCVESSSRCNQSHESWFHR